MFRQTAGKSTRLAENMTSAIDKILAEAHSNRLGGLEYAGEISPESAFAFIKVNPSVIVDVRTAAEWQFVGVPDLSETPSKLLTISWKLYPNFAQNPQFADAISADPAINEDTPLFFLCRSGGRSLDAAVAMTALGYRYSFNISGGFEGEIDESGQRGKLHGWKAARLPWRQG